MPCYYSGVKKYQAQNALEYQAGVTPAFAEQRCSAPAPVPPRRAPSHSRGSRSRKLTRRLFPPEPPAVAHTQAGAPDPGSRLQARGAARPGGKGALPARPSEPRPDGCRPLSPHPEGGGSAEVRRRPVTYLPRARGRDSLQATRERRPRREVDGPLRAASRGHVISPRVGKMAAPRAVNALWGGGECAPPRGRRRRSLVPSAGGEQPQSGLRRPERPRAAGLGAPRRLGLPRGRREHRGAGPGAVWGDSRARAPGAPRLTLPRFVEARWARTGFRSASL